MIPPLSSTFASERETLLEEALGAIRGVVLGPIKSKREQLCLINEIVGEVLYGDFPGTQEAAYDDGRIAR